jgi:superfamily II RNA helicase
VADPFQTEAVEGLQHNDVVVSAPTGSGKTWIAEQAIAQTLSQGRRAWYASPLKALSNAKYHEFGEIFGTANVGILTGDRKENTGAPLIVGTTEILRNQLYDAMYRGRDLGSALVVLDEAHYLGDPDRGVVWEEVIIYLPPRVRLLLLSATVPNAGQIARWLTYVRDAECATVFSDQRPVPLVPLFMMPDGEVTPLIRSGTLFPKVRHLVEKEEKQRRQRPSSHLPPFRRILSAMQAADLLPTIFFLKSRSDCDNAQGQVPGAELTVTKPQSEELNQIVDRFLELYPFLASHPQLATLRSLHVASHHAGHLPHWKLLVEHLMQRGLLKAIFSTSTVAAGVNFPARSVVITQSDRFNGREFVDLTATDLLQMTGRAGRRGMDKIGFAMVVPGPFTNVRLSAALFNSSPEPIESQLHINFSMVLNLLLSHRPYEIKELLSLSLATFQRLERSQGRPQRRRSLRRLSDELSGHLEGSACLDPEEAVVRRRRRRQLELMIQRVLRESDEISQQGGLWGALERGRVFLDVFGNLNAVLRRERHGELSGVVGLSLERDRRLTRGRPRLEFVALNEVAQVYREVLHLPSAGGGRMLAMAALEQIPAKTTPLGEKQLASLARDQVEAFGKRLKQLESQLAEMSCTNCPSLESCSDRKSSLYSALKSMESRLGQVQDESHAFWYDFVRHLEFLKAERLVDPEGRLTDDGKWASKLRLDHPVLIAEAIRNQALPEGDPVLLAALVALFVDDREREGGERYLGRRLKNGIARLRQVLDPMLDLLRQWGFSTPPLPYTAASAVFAWVQMTGFSEAVELYGGAEGDMAQLIYRTSDNLRQIITLEDTHPKLSASAREAVELLLRPPVVVPL